MNALTHLSAMAAGSLIAAIWEGLVLSAIVALCLRLLPGITAAARSVIWLAAMLVVVALPFVHLPGAGSASTAHQLHLDERVSLVLACVWAALSIFRAAELLRSAIYLRGLARYATPIKIDPELAALLDHKRPVALCVSDEVDRPSVAGFFSPRILIPASLLTKLQPAELQQIVLHEMEHLRRGDDWTNLLQKLSLVLFPLNPALVFIERRLCLERELACDDQVLRAAALRDTAARKAYALCLANLAEHSMVRRGVSLALGAWERQSELVRRVHRILSRSNKEMGRRPLAVTVAVMLCGLLAGADVLAHSPALVSFGPAATSVAYTPTPSAPQQLIGGHISLAKATIPAPRPVVLKTSRKRIIIHRNAPALLLSSRSAAEGYAVQTAYTTPAPDASPMVVLVTWRAVSADGSATQASQFSYAAVPVRNGWLFVQL